MKTFLKAFALALLVSGNALAQVPNQIVFQQGSAATVPPPTAGKQIMFLDNSDSKLKLKNPDGSLTPVGSGAGVSSVSSGSASGLFTTNVQNPTTAPSIQYSLTEAPANQFWGGAGSGGLAAPGYRSFVEGDIPPIGSAHVYLTTPLLNQTNQDAFNQQIANNIFSLLSTTCQVTVTQGSGTYTFSLPTFVCINANAAARQTQITGSVLQLTGADSTNSYIDFDTFAGAGSLTCRRADGTGASPSAVQLGETLCQISARGYGATGYSSASRANLQFLAGQNWTDSAQGAGITFNTTPNGGTATAEAARFAPSGDLLIGTTSDGTGLLQVNGAATLSSARFAGATSGVTTVQPAATASGTLTLPAATDTLIGKATTDTLTNKTFDTAGTGNVLDINGTAITAVTGTGSVVLNSGPTITGGATIGGGGVTINASAGSAATGIASGTTTGTLTIGGTAAQTVNMCTSSAAAKTCSIGSTNASSTLTLSGPAGGISLVGVSTGTAADVMCLTSGGVIILQAAGSCTISSERFKEMITDAFAHWWQPIGKVMALRPISFYMKPMLHPNPDHNFDREQLGLSAENVAQVDKRIALYEQDGETPKAYRPEAMISLLTATVQVQQRAIYILMVWCFVLTVAVAYLYLRKRQ